LDACTTGGSNTAIGAEALGSNTTNNNSTALGYSAGSNSTGGGNNIFVGYSPQPNGASDNNTLVISTQSANGKGTSTGFINPNSGGVYQGNNSSSWSTTSDRRLKKNIVDNTEGLDKICQIKVRNFEYRLAGEVTELDSTNAIAIEGVQLGAIAQELQAVLPNCVKTESSGVMSVDSTNITWHMINAIKELKAEFDAYKATHP